MVPNHQPPDSFKKKAKSEAIFVLAGFFVTFRPRQPLISRALQEVRSSLAGFYVPPFIRYPSLDLPTSLFTWHLYRLGVRGQRRTCRRPVLQANKAKILQCFEKPSWEGSGVLLRWVFIFFYNACILLFPKLILTSASSFSFKRRRNKNP